MMSVMRQSFVILCNKCFSSANLLNESELITITTSTYDFCNYAMCQPITEQLRTRRSIFSVFKKCENFKVFKDLNVSALDNPRLVLYLEINS